MKILRTLLPVLVAVGFSSSAFGEIPAKPFTGHVCDKGDISRFDNHLSEKDWEDLNDYINSKRTINLNEKGCNLTIAGDVRVDWRHTNEKSKIDGDTRHIRGGNNIDANGERVPRNDFDIEFNLYFDYVCDRAWTVVQLQFDNTAGVEFNDLGCGEWKYSSNTYEGDGDRNGFHGSGFGCDLNLKKAYMGYNVCCCDDTRFDIEIGRRNLYHVFDSEVQFLSRFDGILLRYSSHSDCAGDWYVNLGAFVIDERSTHFGWVTEIGLLNPCDLCFDFKYSFIDWKKRGKNRCEERNPEGHKFQVSQFTGYYHLDPEMLCMPAKIYGAFIWNHAADSFESDEYEYDIDRDKRYAWYVGFRLGEVIGCGDWALDVQYQYVQAQAVPDRDVSGIGRGNWFDERLTKSGRGNTNYKGWRVEALYAITDNLAFDSVFEASREINKNIGGNHRYSQFQFEAIYAF